MQSHAPETRRLAAVIRKWEGDHGREFAWRASADPYEVLMAEVLLQRTRADLVEPIFLEFVHRFPRPLELASAQPSEVAAVVEPLGLRKRQPLLAVLGAELADKHGGSVPSSEADLLALPLVGRYVANAVRCLAFGEPEPMVDGGVVRVVRRVLGAPPPEVRPLADGLVHTSVRSLLGRRPRQVNLGLIDLSAQVCRRKPRCSECPLAKYCSYAKLTLGAT